MHRIVINGVTYGNVANITDDLEEVPYYDVTTLDGKHHRKIRYSKTHHNVQLFNLLDGVYVGLRDFVKANKNTPVRCGFPDDTTGYVYDDYYLSINGGEINKGYLNGNYYRTGVTIHFQKVNPDE